MDKRKFLQMYIAMNAIVVLLIGTSAHATPVESLEVVGETEIVTFSDYGDPPVYTPPVTTSEPTPTPTPTITPEPTPELTEEPASLEHIQTTLDNIYLLLYWLIVIGSAVFVVWLVISPLWYMFR